MGENIWTSASDGDLERVAELVSSGVDVNAADEFKYTPIHAAVSYGHAALLTWLLEHGASVGILDADGDTPLHVCETAECATILLAHGADVFAQDDEQKTPYHIAVEECRDEMVEWMKAQYAARGEQLPHVEVDDDEEEGEGTDANDENDDEEAGNEEGAQGDAE